MGTEYLLPKLKKSGFDLSKKAKGGGWIVQCSQCEALVINGVPCHEHGCPNKGRVTICKRQR